MKSRLFLPGAARLAFVFAAVAWSQELPTAKPESVGLSPEKLARIGPAMQAPMTGHKRAREFQALGSAVRPVATRRGQIAHSTG